MTQLYDLVINCLVYDKITKAILIASDARARPQTCNTLPYLYFNTVLQSAMSDNDYFTDLLQSH
jgi:hypothetical protein